MSLYATMSGQERILYRVVYEYLPNELDLEMGYIEIREGDVIYVKKSFTPSAGTVEKPDGWLEGFNTRTKISGWFPGSYVEFVRSEPPRPPPSPAPRTSRQKPLNPTNDDSGYCPSPQGKQFCI